MRKKYTKYFLLLIVSSISYSATISINSLLNNIGLSNLPITAECNLPSASASFPNQIDICSIANKINQLSLDNLNYFDIPFCTIKNLNTPNAQLNKTEKTIANICQKNMTNISNNKVLKTINDTTGLIKEANKIKFINTVSNNNNCNTPLTFDSANTNKIDQSFEQLAQKENSDIYFTREGTTQKNCIELLIEDGSSIQEATNKCSIRNLYINASLDSNSAETKEEKKKIVKEVLKTPDIFSPIQNRNSEKELKLNLINRCGNKITIVAAKECEKKYLKNTYNIVEKKDTTNKKIDSNSAILQTVIKKATTQKYQLNSPTEKTKKKLPLIQQKEFVFLSQKYLSQKTLIKSIENEINTLEKELANLIYEKREVCAKPLYDKAILKQLNNSMQNIRAEDE